MMHVFSFGELLLRMSPELGGKWLDQSSMPVYVGGAELNMAGALASWDIPVKYFSAAPDNYLTKEILKYLEERNIDTSAIHFSGEKIGVYILAQGTDLKHAGVIYDRAHSSFSELRTGMIDWEKALKDCNWFHFSAISPALNENVAAVCEEALKAASAKGLMISVDLNYRSKLWKYGKKPVEVMPGLAKYCNLIMGNIWSANELLGIPVDSSIHDKNSKEAYLDHARQTSEAIMKNFDKCVAVANTYRFDEGSGIRYYAALDHGGKQFVSPEFVTKEVVDKVGSGDCFMAGLVYGFHSKHKAQQIIDFAAAAAFGKLHEKGDITSQSVENVNSILSRAWPKMKI